MKAVEGKRKILKRKQTKSLLIQFQLFTEIFSRTSTIHPRISLGRAIWAGSVSLRMNTVALRDQFKPIRIGENLVVNKKDNRVSGTIGLTVAPWKFDGLTILAL